MKFPNFLRIGIVPNFDIFTINSSEKTFVQIIGGLEANFVKLLSEGLNFTYSAHVPSDKEWGRLVNGNWTGILGLVTTNKTDIGISKIGINEQKLSAVDFSYPYSIERVTFATQPPGLLSKKNAVVLPFSWGLWTAVLLALVFISFAFKLILKRNYSFQYIFLYAVGSIVMKSKGIKSENAGERFLVSAWLLSSMLLSYSYMAVLLSFLTIPLKEEPVNYQDRLLEVLDKGIYKCFTPGGSAVLNSLLHSEDQTVKSIATHIDKNNWLISPTKELLVDTMNRKKTAAINPKNHFRIMLPDKILLANDYFFLLYWGIAVNKDFCCKKELDFMVHRIVASGLYQKSENDFYFQSRLKYSKLYTPEAERDEVLTLRDVVGAFLILLSGYILAFISFVVEIVYAKKKSKRKMKHKTRRLKRAK